MERLVIHPKDIQIVTGRTERYGRKVINKIKATLKKQPHQLVTIQEYCSYAGLSENHVKQILFN